MSTRTTFNSRPIGIGHLLLFAACVALPMGLQAQRITTFAGGGFTAAEGVDRLDASFSRPEQMAFDANGSLYFAELLSSRIRKIDTNGIVTTVAGGVSSGFGGDNGPATAARLRFPYGIAIDSVGDIIIADTFNHRIRKVTVANGIIRTIAGIGSSGSTGDGGAATFAQLDRPRNIAIGPNDEIYFSDRDNHRIRKINGAGVISTVAGNGTPGFFGDGGLALTASLSRPTGLAFYGTNRHLLISDSSNDRIRRLDLSSGIITTFAGSGSGGGGGGGGGGFSGDGGAATNAVMNGPEGIVVSAENEVFFADLQNERVRKVDTNGIITTVAGNGIGVFAGDGGLPAFASLNGPSGVAVDQGGALFISEGGNDRIRRVDFGARLTEWLDVNLYGSEPAGGLGSMLFSQPATATMGNRVYTAGSFAAGNLQIGSTVYANPDAASDGMIMRLSESGAVNWASHISANQDATADGIIAAPSENRLYAFGTFRDSATFGSTFLQVSNGPATSGWLARMTTGGAYNWVVKVPETFNGQFGVYISDLASDTNGNLTLLGSFNSGVADFGNGVVLTNGGTGEAFVVKYNNSGQAVWVKKVANISNNNQLVFGGKLKIHSDNHIYAAIPHVASTLGPSAGGIDVSLVHFDDLGNQQWSLRLGSSFDDTAADLVISPAGDLFFLANFSASGASFAGQGLGTNGITGTNMMLAKVTSSGVVSWIQQSFASVAAEGRGVFYDVNSDTVYAGMDFAGTMLIGEFNFASVPSGLAFSRDGLLLRVKGSDGTVLSTLNTSASATETVRAIGRLSTGAIYGVGDVGTDITEFTGNLITNNFLGASHPYYATVNDLPLVGLQPVSQTNDAGTNVTFSVLAGGGVPLSYQWLKNGSDLAGETGLSLSVSNISIVDEAAYSVRVTNILGSTFSSNAVLTVNQPVSIVAHPQTQFGIETFGVQFNVTPFGSTPFAYQWFKGSAAISGGTNNPLTLTNLSSSDNGNYHVVVTNAFGSASSFAATLTTFPTSVLPSITAQPQSVSTNVGRVASFAVQTAGQAPLGFSWFKDGTNIAGAHSSQYFDFDVQLGDIGGYQVVVSNIFGVVTSAVANLNVVVPQVPNILTEPTDVTVVAGTNVTLSFTHGGTSPFLYQWVKNGFMIGGQTSPSLVLNNVTASDAGDYQGKVSNDAGSRDTRLIRLTVWTVPTLTQAPVPVIARNTGSATLSAAASGIPDPQFQWFKDGVQLTNIVGYVGAQSENLSTVGTAAEHVGSYFVRVFNSAGSVDSALVTLSVLFPPTITTPQFSGGMFSFSVSESAGTLFSPGNVPPFQVQYSSNLPNWLALTNPLIFTNGQFRFQDTLPAQTGSRLYRIIEP
jgi:sugar lactone lactonase YvrE